MNKKSHASNDQEKNSRQLIDLKSKGNMKRPNRNKIEIVGNVGVAAFDLEKYPDAYRKGEKYNAASNHTNQRFRQDSPGQTIDDKTQQGKERNEPGYF